MKMIDDSMDTDTGCVSKNLTANKNACQTKLTIGKWSSFLILHDRTIAVS